MVTMATSVHTAIDSQERALDTLRPLAAVGAVIMLGFLVYNVIEFPAGLRGAIVAHDIVCAAACAGTWGLIRAGKIPDRAAHAVGTGLILLIASNILLATWLRRDPSQVVYIDILLVATSAAMTAPRWGAAAFLGVWGMSIPVLLAVSAGTPHFGRYVATMAATTGVAAALLTLRLRNLRALSELRARDQQRRRALQDALADLDAKVATRTAELQSANDALRTEMIVRERAEKEARQLTEQLLHAQRLESLGRLAGGVAHDFNNLLTVISANVELALDELPENANKELLNDSLGATKRAAKLTKQLLAFGRKQVFERSVFDLGRRVEEVARMLERAVGERIELQVSASERGLWVSADPNHIEQALMNLAVNARDAMPDGGALVVLVERVSTRGTSWVRIRVRDNGVGMDADTIGRMFEPFFTTKPSGTGLGLSTVYGIVQQHDGFVEVDSKLGVGTTLDLFLPACAPPVREAVTSRELIAGAPGTETVLLVEDEDAVRRVGERLLRRDGYSVLAAASGAEALSIVQSLARPVDLLFTDVMMPGMNGRELAVRLRGIQPNLKVLFVSGYTGDYLETQTGELPEGAHFLYKPYEPAEASRLIRDILDGRAAKT